MEHKVNTADSATKPNCQWLGAKRYIWSVVWWFINGRCCGLAPELCNGVSQVPFVDIVTTCLFSIPLATGNMKVGKSCG